MICTSLLHYRIVDKLGAEGMCEVYRAEDTNLDRQVAIMNWFEELKLLAPAGKK